MCWNEPSSLTTNDILPVCYAIFPKRFDILKISTSFFNFSISLTSSIQYCVGLPIQNYAH